LVEWTASARWKQRSSTGLLFLRKIADADVFCDACRFESVFSRYQQLRKNMPRNIDEMVVVASGRSVVTTDWCRALNEKQIRFAIARPHDNDSPTPIDHEEIMVEREMVEEARTAIRNACGADSALIW
jgi:hypothetical protein